MWLNFAKPASADILCLLSFVLGTNCATQFHVKLQLTSSKSIDIKFPCGGGRKSAADITGIEMFAPDCEGCRAVRIVNKKKAWHLVAADVVKDPDGELPARWEDTPRQPSWELPRPFQAPHAALAVNSPFGTFSQSTADAILQDMSAGLDFASASASPKSDSGGKRFGVRKAQASPPGAPKHAAKPDAPARRPSLPAGGESVSENGRRFVSRPMPEPGFHLYASLPEFQTLWVSRLLPEGRRPTASSIQVAESALMASVFLQPEFRSADGDALAIFVRRDAVFFAGYRKGEPVLWLRCPSSGGSAAMKSAIVKTLGVGSDLVDSVLNESLIDPRPALEPFVRPILAQLELSLAYLASKHSLKFDHALLMGLDAGAAHWSTYAEEALRLRLVAPDPFDGLVVGKGVESDRASGYLVALGAAIAGAEASQ
jgi:hypothetical protein